MSLNFSGRPKVAPWVLGLALACLVWTGSPVSATEQGGRFTMTPIEGGFLRLDTQTGVVSVCQRRDGRWSCETVADDRAALSAEIARLKRENASLRRRLAERKTAPPAPSTPQPSEPPAPALPSEAEVDRFFGLIEHFIQRFRDMMERLTPGRDLDETPL